MILNIEELKENRRNCGDAFVPRSYPAYTSLGKWVQNQRQGYKRFMLKEY
jgi:hypothetical protein